MWTVFILNYCPFQKDQQICWPWKIRVRFMCHMLFTCPPTVWDLSVSLYGYFQVWRCTYLLHIPRDIWTHPRIRRPSGRSHPARHPNRYQKCHCKFTACFMAGLDNEHYNQIDLSYFLVLSWISLEFRIRIFFKSCYILIFSWFIEL